MSDGGLPGVGIFGTSPAALLLVPALKVLHDDHDDHGDHGDHGDHSDNGDYDDHNALLLVSALKVLKASW